MAQSKARIVFTGGGSGGHIFPLIAVAREIKSLAKQNNLLVQVVYIGPDTFSEVLEKEEIAVKFVVSGKLRRYLALENFLSPLFILIGFFQALWHLWLFMPNMIFSKGGYGSLPVIFVAYFIGSWNPARPV